MSSISIPLSIRAISTKLPNFNLFPSSSLKPLICSSFSSFKSISFQRIPTKPPQSIPSQSSSSSLQSIEELPPKLQEIIKLFQAAQDPKAKYQQLMFYANKLPPLQDQYKTNDNKVQGCVSQVWVRAFLDNPPNNNNNNENQNVAVYFEADSDSIMTKGLAALLVLGLSGCSISEILRVSPDFITLLGLQQNLTPSRNNGFLNMLKMIQRKALLLGMEAEKNQETKLSGMSSQMGTDHFEPKQELNDSSGVESLELDTPNKPSSGLGSRGERIREKLEKELKPIELELEDISYQHAGHVGVKGSDGETHFNLKIVSNEFEGKSLVKRHRMIYSLLQDELEGGLHALSIIAKTPAEVEVAR
ncbi:sufE-like protein 1, chloroplastic/mitochondrial [Amaranthus tricolor]|uniref:sufE-like protein 1, chloroplastic/mitochondrial n=1 Tax=Amaranthus tricolor TaxID=29722 RepID=UPI00258C3FA5|nr:sufE-like protein 1, chloroplastic/mitochondrial [Amaranthus tricolor]